jgi:hypothetical protein
MVKVQAREKVATRRRWREGNMAVAWVGVGQRLRGEDAKEFGSWD